MKNKFLITIFFLICFNLNAQEKINDVNQNGLPDQHENSILRTAERICNMPGIQDILSKQIEDLKLQIVELKTEKEKLEKTISDNKIKFDIEFKEKENQCNDKIKDINLEKDKLLSTLSDKKQELAVCEIKQNEKLLDRFITAGIGVFGASSCFFIQKLD